MTTLRGKQILDKVRSKIGDDSYASYDEINEAQDWIAKQTGFTWLRKQSTSAVGLVDGTNEYTLNLVNVRRLVDVWIKGTDDDYYRLMEELPSRLFEEKVAENSLTEDYSMTDADDRWYYNLLAADSNSGVFGKIRVTPTPDTTYTIRVDYIKDVDEITPEIIPDIPNPYVNTLINLASGYILERAVEQERAIYGLRLIKRAEASFDKLVHDSQPNRTVDIDRKPQPWRL
jgi:hypothetical protein